MEKWADQRNDAYNKCTAVVQQKTAQAVASNAVKLERARSLALDKIIAALERLPENGGSHIRQSQPVKNGKYITVDFDLADLVSALDKLSRNSAASGDNALLDRAREILGGVASAID